MATVRPQVVETNADLLTANLCTFQFVEIQLESPNFDRIEGLSRAVETVEKVDGGSGLKRKYHGGVVNYEDVSIVRMRDNTLNDRKLSDWVSDYTTTGLKQDAIMHKRHHGKVIRSVEFLGLNGSSEALPSYDNASAAAEEITYAMQCDYWEEVFTV
jgi:hypothetical protein